MASATPVIAVAGNVNADLSYDVERLPLPGETLAADGLRIGPGGKAANAAVAIARLGASARVISSVGGDPLGALALAALRDAGVDIRWIVRRPGETTGVATVFVAPAGHENAIVTHLGANLLMTADDVPALRGCDALLMTLGLPHPALAACIQAARAAGIAVLVDATPLRTVPLDASFTAVDLLSANRVEAAALTGLDAVDDEQQIDHALTALHGLGAREVVLKLGAGGAAWSDGAGRGRTAAPVVDAIDPTGAGDAFMGALAVRRARGDALPDATAYACLVGALATTGRGAQGGWASLDDVHVLAAQRDA
ncbi:MAG: ribokinase [bacterium]